MGWLGRTLAFFQVVMVFSPSYASDVAFGVDSLPVLIDSADVVVAASRIELLETTDDYRVYGATFGEVIAGNAAIGRRVRFAVPQLLALAEGDLGGDALLFLTGPLDRATSASVTGRNTDSLFWLTGGSYGRIDRTDARIAAIRSYERFQEDERRSPWIMAQLRDSDELLQRSALIELTKPQYADDPATYSLLGTTATNQSAAEATQDLALELLQISASPLALPALRAVAVADATTEGRRVRAIRSIGAVEGGEAVLSDLAQNPLSGDLATAELQQLKELIPLASVLEGLASVDLQIRAQAISDLRRTTVTGNTLNSVAPLIDAFANTNLGERAILLEHLGALNNADAAALLARVAQDQNQSETVRNAAIIALAQMDPSVSRAALQSLAANLEDGTLKDLVDMLAD